MSVCALKKDGAPSGGKKWQQREQGQWGGMCLPVCVCVCNDCVSLSTRQCVVTLYDCVIEPEDV